MEEQPGVLTRGSTRRKKKGGWVLLKPVAVRGRLLGGGEEGPERRTDLEEGVAPCKTGGSLGPVGRTVDVEEGNREIALDPRPSLPPWTGPAQVRLEAERAVVGNDGARSSSGT